MAPARLHLDLVLKESILAAEWNHSGLPQLQLVQLVQDGSSHPVAQQTQQDHQQNHQAANTTPLLWMLALAAKVFPSIDLFFSFSSS